MLDIKQVETNASELFEIYNRIEIDLLKNIAKRISEDGEITGTGQWQLKKLAQLGEISKEHEKIIAKHSKKSKKIIKKVIQEAGYQSVEVDEKVYQMAFANDKLDTVPIPLKASPYIKKIIEISANRAVNYMNLVNTTALESSNKLFTDTVNQCYLEVVQGIYTSNQAMKKAVKTLVDNGIKGAHYVSKNGRHTYNNIDVAVRRMIFTTTRQLSGDIQMQRAKEWGADLVEVTSHMGARPSHAKWQGRVYSISGKSKKYKPLIETTGYGEITGLKGINCNHDFYPFFEGLNTRRYYPYDEEENNKIYKDRQKQRKIERDIRKEKQKIMLAKEQGDFESELLYRKKLREKQEKLRKHLKKTGLTRHRDREQVYGFDNKTSEGAKKFKKASKKADKKVEKDNTKEYNEDDINDVDMSKLREICSLEKIDYQPIQRHSKKLSEKEIIDKIGGLDKTKGSCSSVALAYIGNMGEYDVMDFRDGKSRDVFSSLINIQRLLDIKNVKGFVESDYNDLKAVVRLLKNVDEDKKYYLGTGKHAAIIRKNNKNIEYLELQDSGEYNGFKTLTAKELIDRFKCKKTHSHKFIGKYEAKSILIDIDTLKDNKEFHKILGYINTSSSKQMKGAGGSVK